MPEEHANVDGATDDERRPLRDHATFPWNAVPALIGFGALGAYLFGAAADPTMVLLLVAILIELVRE